MNRQSDERIREIVGHLAEAVGEPAAYADLQVGSVSAAPTRRHRPALVFVGAAVVALVLVGLPLAIFRNGETPPSTVVAPVATTSPASPSTAPPNSVPPSTLATGPGPMETFDVAGQQWVQGRAHVGVVGSDGVQQLELDIRLGPKSIAWDGSEGLVYVTNDQELRWITPTSDELVRVLDQQVSVGEQSLLDVVVVDGTPLAALSGAGATVEWIDLATGDSVAGPDERFRLGEGYEPMVTYVRIVNGVAASIEASDWEGIPRGEGGEPLPPFPPPQLVVADETGAEILRTEVGSEDRPYAILHDFDGERLIYSVEPHEPALPPRTVYIIDLGCSDCTQVIESDGSADWFDLVGS